MPSINNFKIVTQYYNKLQIHYLQLAYFDFIFQIHAYYFTVFITLITQVLKKNNSNALEM